MFLSPLLTRPSLFSLDQSQKNKHLSSRRRKLLSLQNNTWEDLLGINHLEEGGDEVGRPDGHQRLVGKLLLSAVHNVALTINCIYLSLTLV